jgi:hypothetical protein
MANCNLQPNRKGLILVLPDYLLMASCNLQPNRKGLILVLPDYLLMADCNLQPNTGPTWLSADGKLPPATQ